MEKYLAGIVVALAASFSYAQSPEDEIKILQGKSQCAKEKMAVKLIDSFEELPFLRGISIRDDGDYPVMFFVNRKTGTWTLLENHNGYYCILASGDNFAVHSSAPEASSL